jgi:hypothetical protein
MGRRRSVNNDNPARSDYFDAVDGMGRAASLRQMLPGQNEDLSYLPVRDSATNDNGMRRIKQGS